MTADFTLNHCNLICEHFKHHAPIRRTVDLDNAGVFSMCQRCTTVEGLLDGDSLDAPDKRVFMKHEYSLVGYTGF